MSGGWRATRLHPIIDTYQDIKKQLSIDLPEIPTQIVCLRKFVFVLDKSRWINFFWSKNTYSLFMQISTISVSRTEFEILSRSSIEDIIVMYLHKLKTKNFFNKLLYIETTQWSYQWSNEMGQHVGHQNMIE